MQIFSNLKAMAIIMALAAIGFFYLIASKPAIEQPPALDTPALSDHQPDFIAQAEARREQKLEALAEQERQAKQQYEKEHSVECQFWKQQKNDKSPPKVDEKIAEFCNL